MLCNVGGPLERTSSITFKPLYGGQSVPSESEKSIIVKNPFSNIIYILKIIFIN
jgi:hypothetical protein